MANIDQAFGLRPIAKVGSAPGGTTGTTKYTIASGASGIFTGDPVKQSAKTGSLMLGPPRELKSSSKHKREL